GRADVVAISSPSSSPGTGSPTRPRMSRAPCGIAAWRAGIYLHITPGIGAPATDFIASLPSLDMRTGTSFWPRRLRWQLLAAWRWPALVVLSFVDGALATALSPVSGHTKFIPAVIISLFANLFLVGAVAPWLARRIAARRGQALPEPEFPPVDSG